MSSNKVQVQEDTDEVKEESWNLPSDFDLFAKHQVRSIYYPLDRNDEESSELSLFQIECIEPDSPLDILNDRSSKDQKCDSTGHCVWAGAFLLISCLQELFMNDGVVQLRENIIEFGCGTGIGGLAILMMPSSLSSCSDMHICFTDNDLDALKVCQRNCDLNKLSPNSYSIHELTWGRYYDNLARKAVGFDIALATDVLYDIDLIHPLLISVTKSLKQGGVFILSHIPRVCYHDKQTIPDNLERHIIDCATMQHGLELVKILRRKVVPKEWNEWCPPNAFSGGAVFVFQTSV